tara:strand:- start:736 stop:858 length:123 start_codon:yes stop_codon:yes gene_type:complete
VGGGWYTGASKESRRRNVDEWRGDGEGNHLGGLVDTNESA